jgi:hypothetical protein
MATDKQITANRRNARSSTGPKTAAGKASSSRNALRHGVLSKNAVSRYEDKEEYEALLQQLIADLEPDAAIECVLVERLATLFWREKRLAESEASQINRMHAPAQDLPYADPGRDLDFKSQYLIGRYQGMLGRQVRETLHDLHQMKQQRLALLEQAPEGHADN